MVVQSPHTVESSVPTAKNASKREKVSPPDKDNFSGERRASARLQAAAKQKAEKALLSKRRVEFPEKDGGGGRIRKKPHVENEMVKPADTENGTQQLLEVSTERTDPKVSERVAKMVERAAKIAEGLDGINANAPNLVEKSAHIQVKETLRFFNKHYLHFIQEEQKRCGDSKAAKKAGKGAKKAGKVAKKAAMGKKKSPKGMKAEERDIPEGDGKGRAKRPDLKAISKEMICPNVFTKLKYLQMMERNEVLYPEKRIGSLPGIDVGHRFYSRAEMVAVGFHSHWLNGIDYMGQAYKKGEYKNYKFPLAVAIVLSGMYEDDLDNAEDVVYTGQGGHDLTGNKRQIRDQVMERGNLALKNCVEQGVPVRVIRGHESTSSYSGKIYTYDGLYKVVKYWAEKGLSGFTVYKYRLRRLEGQPILTTSQVQFTYGSVPKTLSEIRGGGQENIPIPATNLVDDPPVAPTGKSKNPRKLPANAAGCDCKEACWNPKTCACARLNGSDFPYVNCKGGRLIEAKHVVFECGPKCGCSLACVNRTSQRGLRYRLEVFRTPMKGWAVRSWDFIPAGAPVCEYIGVLTRTEELDSVSENNFIFDIDCLQTMRGLGGRERRQQDASLPMIQDMDKADEQRSENVPEFCIDAGSFGNVARFINHSCEPNLFIQCVLSAHHDFKLARVMLFAADNIPPLQELTYDYGYALDSVHGPDGKVKRMACYCGAEGCRKRLF
ncbi:hypothetical protein COLO4_13375 [Corchorus olitorius]|uniref:SET domain-containing protein n=1 Tax=Corchorus olitorius TaxID=93759 RepID=A0A1R3JWQ2_9ROSI|nr:hypothetical protein COLO4_13375 [Corchorus olitorius]